MALPSLGFDIIRIGLELVGAIASIMSLSKESGHGSSGLVSQWGSTISNIGQSAPLRVKQNPL